MTADGYLCLPLLLDPAVAQDLARLTPGDRKLPGAPPPLLSAGGRLFTPALRLASLAESCEILWPERYQEARQGLFRELDLPPEAGPVLDDKLAAIVFGVLPHFVRLTSPPARGRPREAELLHLLARRLTVPSHYYQEAEALASPAALARRLEALEGAAGPPPEPPAGLVDAQDLEDWLTQALRARIAGREREALTRRLQDTREAGEGWLARTALLLYLADKGSLEIDGFGFARLPRTPGDYRVYRRTGEYALKDYYGRLYLFPDCRVAVSTHLRLRPVVLETYKHPFLRRHGPGQEICLPQGYQPPFGASAGNIIAALEAGLNALFYGYNPRRRNGYHSLDRIRPEPDLSFDDYRIPPDDPRLVSGQVEVKNQYA